MAVPLRVPVRSDEIELNASEGAFPDSHRYSKVPLRPPSWSRHLSSSASVFPRHTWILIPDLGAADGGGATACPPCGLLHPARIKQTPVSIPKIILLTSAPRHITRPVPGRLRPS